MDRFVRRVAPNLAADSAPQPVEDAAAAAPQRGADAAAAAPQQTSGLEIVGHFDSSEGIRASASLTKLMIQHVAKNHPEWMITPQGEVWVEEINQKVDVGWFRMTSSFALAHQPSVCPVCSRQLLQAPPISAASTCTSTEQPPPHWHSLLVAVWHNDIQHLQVLLQDPNILRQIDNGPGFGDDRSALYHAVRNDQPDFVRLLLQARANPFKHMKWQPRTPNRPPVSTTPYQAAETHQGRIKDVFNEVLWSHAPAPAPPPPPLRKIQLDNGTFVWV